jgi:3-oxoacyl-[acyl-carrier protein] reductase
LVTGVSRSEGIGFAIAQRLVADGYAVFTQGWQAHDESQPWGAGEVPLREGFAGHLEADLADPEAPEAVLAAARIALGNVDVLVANHAASVGGTLEEATAASIDTALVVNVNVRATLLLVKAFAAGFEGAHGRVVLLTSGQGRGPMPSELPYIAGKAALSGSVLSLADHLAPRGVTVNAVNPGPTDTGGGRRRWSRAPRRRCRRAAGARPRTPRGWWRGWRPRSPRG